MDAVKIIKKHGSPGGIPVVTAYVDADAPGEGGTIELYQHTLLINKASIVLITDDDTPFTNATFGQFLLTNGIISTNFLPTNSNVGFSKLPPYPGQLEVVVYNAVYATPEGDARITSETRRISVGESGLDITAAEQTANEVNIIKDVVIKIGE